MAVVEVRDLTRVSFTGKRRRTRQQVVALTAKIDRRWTLGIEKISEGPLPI